ncbi:MAG TPA: lantibiotic dehydratase, partial [Longimicrobium sp.]|nr:lantibiotic dehydratase [Longimicrobium sp.]
EGEAQGTTRFSRDPREKRSFVRINKFLYGLLFDHLKTRPAFRHALAVERNPTLRGEGGRLVFLTSIDGREVFQRLADNEVLQLIASRFREGTEPTLGDLIDALSADPEIDATPDEAEAYLDKLIEIGFLRFHMGIREQDADWDLPLAALLERIDDPHAQRAAALLRTVRTQTEVYATASVHERPEVIAGMLKLIEDEFEEMGIGQRLRKDMPFYEDATSEAHAKVGLTPGVRRAFGSFEEWCRTTSSLAWPRSEQATMRHFFNDFYGQGARVPLLKFYEDFYREHFKAHVEKENRARAGMGGANLEGYDVNNPFGLQFITDLNSARGRLGEAVRKRWEADPDTRTLDITPEDVEKAFEGVETHSTSPRSMGAFALLAPGEGEDEPSLILNNTSYTSGYGKYFSRFLYMLPFDVQEDVRKANAALAVGDELLAEICGDAQFNANLHPPLLRWEISYPTGESGATEDQIRSSDLLVEEDPEEPQSLAVRHGPSGKRVIPLDLGFLNPRMRPPLYQLLSRFTTPVIFAPTLPETPWPRAQQQPAPAPQPQPGTDTVDEGPADTVDQDTVDQDTVDQDTVARNAAPAPPPPPQAREPRVIFRPRITYRNSLVLARRHWTVPSSLFPQQRADESAADFFVRANRWRAEHGIPETCYLKVMPIPEAPQRPQGAPGAGGPAAPPPAAPPEELPGYEAPVAEMGHDEDEHDHDGDDHEHDEHDEHEGHDHHHEGDDHGHAHAPGGAPAAQPHAHAPGAPPAGGGRPPIPGAWAPGGAKKRTQPSRDYLKPQFMDFGNPLLVGLFGRVAAGLKSYQVIVEERYPDRPALPRHGDSRYVTELVIQVNFPAGTAGAAAGAGELAEAAQ